ncbi:glycoside hydrolase family 55 protein [Sphingopyxis sp. PET50]|uniref:glycoside hydrolase family 55 protein n=1 Tax=Sphingopyxis sp. PET50 TaxID=2976533 RepID=UPI0021AF1E5B|nr:glycoside hydrolase family 55 protein [Sphingopyxis sp. PET50]
MMPFSRDRCALGLMLSVAVTATLPALAKSPVLPKILSDRATMTANPLPDYSYAGYGFGLMPIPDDAGTVVDVTTYGVIPDDGLDDSKAVLRAIEAANAVQGRVTLRFPKGRTQITEVLRITRSDIVLDGAGAGPGGSELWFPRPLKLIDQSHDYDELRAYLVREKKQQVEPEHNIDYLFTEYSWAGGMILVAPPAVAQSPTTAAGMSAIRCWRTVFRAGSSAAI